MTWNPRQLPDQTGRTVLITGGNAGLGYFAAEQLAKSGAKVIIASRNQAKADAALSTLRRRVMSAQLESMSLDLSSLASARSLGDRVAQLDRLDGVILNAGLTSGDRVRKTTSDGHELVVGTNYIGHFALLARLWPALERSASARVIGLGSMVTWLVKLDAGDLQSERRFDFFRAYGFSKHAMHGLIFELDRRARASGSRVSAVLAHPGLSLDGLTARRAGIVPDAPAERMLAAVAQGKNRGAAPVVRALVDPLAQGGDFFGPQFLLKGPPVRLTAASSSASPEFGRDLWRRSEEWIGEPFAL